MVVAIDTALTVVHTNVSTNILSFWDGSDWTPQVVISYPTDPTMPVCDSTVWLDGTGNAHLWNGVSWCDAILYNQGNDPSLITPAPCGSYWFDTATNVMYKWDDKLGIWIVVSPFLKLNADPNALPLDFYWFNTTDNTLSIFNDPLPGWNLIPQANVRITEQIPMTPAVGTYWYNPTTQVLQQWNGASWITLPNLVVFATDPTVRHSCDVWWNTAVTTAPFELNVWDDVNGVWNMSPDFFQQPIDPTLPPTIVEGTLWLNSTTLIMYIWQNGCWIQIPYIDFPTDPRTSVSTGTVWFNGTNWFNWNGSVWVQIFPTYSTIDPTTIPNGTYWFNTSNNTLNIWNGLVWVNLMYSLTSLAPPIGTLWFDETTDQLKQWNGSMWVPGTPLATVEINCHGDFIFTSGVTGSSSFIAVSGTLFLTVNGQPSWTPTGNVGSLWTSLDFQIQFANPQPGNDGVSATPSYLQLGVGTDGSADERYQLMNEIRYQLGYPVVNVELTEQQLDHFITKAIEELRSRTAVAYSRGFFFMTLQGEVQQYQLTAVPTGFNKIVTVLGVYRLTSAFLSSAHGAGVYGQIVLQHLYNMGTFDLLSYHIISNYISNMEILFAARVTFTWNEQTRVLWLHHRFPFAERMVLIEASLERKEQDILSDRWTRPWLRRWALALSRIALAETRGKWATLPGAGGQVSLNAAELRQAGKDEIDACIKEIEDFIVDRPEEFGLGTIYAWG